MTWAASFLLTAAGTATAAEPNAADRDPNVLAVFPIFNDGDVLLVPVTVGDKSYQFAVDTGCTFTVFDPQFESAFTRMKNRGEAAVEIPGVGRLEWAVAKEFSIEGLPSFRTRRVLLKDLALVRESSGYDINGVIGMDLLQAFVMRIDVDNARLQFLKVAPETELPTVAMRLKRGCPFVQARLAPDVSKDFMFDTGAVNLGVLLEPTLFQILADCGQLRDLSSIVYSTPGQVLKARSGLLLELELLDGPVVNDLRAKEELHGPNTLGLEFILKFNVVLDFPHAALQLMDRTSLEPNKLLAIDSGLAFKRPDETTVIDSVRKDSRGAAAGIEADDIVESVEGRPPAEYRLHVIRMMMRTKGPDLELTVRTPGGKPRRVMLSRQDKE